MPQISIIVPVYKVEPYLRRCIDSILDQSFEDFELILVDDDSPDNCPAICDEYAAKDHRIKVIHKRNSGVSSARNAALDIASGAYIMFCDSDDTVDPRWCELHYQMIVQHPDAWVVSNITKENLDGEYTVVGSMAEDSRPQSYFDIYRMGLSPFVWNKIYCQQRINRIGLKFDEYCSMGEDIAFNVKYYATCSEIAYILEPMYFYYQNATGIMGTYRANLFELNLPHFAVRLPLIQDHELADFCDEYLFNFLNWLDNTMDSRNPMTFFQKLRYNQKMMNTPEFTYCLSRASGKRDSKLFMKIVRFHNYYIYWLFQQICAIKAKLKRTD